MAGSAPVRRLSLAAVTLRGASPVELATAAAGAGFDAVGVRLSPWDLSNPTVPTLSEVRGAARAIQELGLSVLDVEQIRLVPDARPRDYEYLFEGAALLGAHFALLYSDDPDEERLTANLAELDAIAAPYAVHPVIEPMPFTSVSTLEVGLRILRAAQVRRPALLIDTLHLARSGGSAADIAAIDPRVLPFIHLADGPAVTPATAEARFHEAGRSRRLPGQGELPLLDYLAAAPAEIPLALEVPGASEGTELERATAAAAATRALLDQLVEAR